MIMDIMTVDAINWLSPYPIKEIKDKIEDKKICEKKGATMVSDS